MTNGPAITEENRVRSMAKLTTLGKAVPGALTGIGTGKTCPYRPPVPPAAAFPKSNPIKVVKGPALKREPFVAKTELPSTRSICTTPKEIHHHSSSIPSPISFIAIAITIVIEIP
jgi:hypothetical protein